MANVPTVPLPESESSAAPTPYERGNASPEDYGAAIGRGLHDLGAGVDRMEAEADATRAQGQEAAFRAYVNEQLDGKVDPETGAITPGFRHSKGQEALDASGPLRQALEEKRNELEQGLANDRQRRLFRDRTHGALMGALGQVEQHTGSAIESIRDQAFVANFDESARAAVGAYQTPQESQRIIEQDMRPWLDVEAERQGLTGDAAAKWIRAQQGAVVVQVLERMLEDTGRGRAGMASQAKAFLEANRDKVSEKDAYKLRAQLAAGDIRERSALEADRIWAEAGGDPQVAIAQVRAIKDVDLRDATGDRIDKRVREDHALRQAADSPHVARLEVEIARYNRIDRTSADYQALSDEGKAIVEQKLHAEKRADTREQKDLDRTRLFEFRAQSPAEQVATNIDQDPRFQDATGRARAEMKFWQGKAREGIVAGTGIDEREARFKVDAIANELGWPSGRDAIKRNRLWQDVETGMELYRREHPGAKTVPAAELEKILGRKLRLGQAPTGVLGMNIENYYFQAEQKGPKAAAGFQPYAEAAKQRGLTALRRVMGGDQPTVPLPPESAPAGPVRVRTEAEWKALRPGTVYVGPDGKTRTKKATE